MSSYELCAAWGDIQFCGDYHEKARCSPVHLPVACPLGATLANAQTMRMEAKTHPRIVQAIRELEDAIGYMENAPNNFGGHKAAAIAASRAASRIARFARFPCPGDRR